MREVVCIYRAVEVMIRYLNGVFEKRGKREGLKKSLRKIELISGWWVYICPVRQMGHFLRVFRPDNL